jgi:2-(3-amino-3-carboxypropyl)histidine synthase
MLFGCVISDILREFAAVPIETVIMGDVTYGACCVDDLASEQMNCDLLVHYGHSCLVPITDTRRKVLYVFVEIQIDIEHFVDTVVFNFSALAQRPLYLLATIQFNNSLFLAKQALLDRGFTGLVIPQEKPRSAGEVLGCTSPRLPLGNSRNIVIFLCDGRFHMEASMIANPEFEFYQYSPYSR